MTDVDPPSRTARLVVGLLACFVLVTGTWVLGLVAFFAWYVGTPTWAVAIGVLAVLVGVGVAFHRIRLSAVGQQRLNRNESAVRR